MGPRELSAAIDQALASLAFRLLELAAIAIATVGLLVWGVVAVVA